MPGSHKGTRSAQRALPGERETAELREQFIAVLGHDLRTRSYRSCRAPKSCCSSTSTRLPAKKALAPAAVFTDTVADEVTRQQ